MKKIFMLLLLGVLVGCGKADLQDKKHEEKMVDVDRLLGTWEAIDDKFTVEMLNTNEKKIYKLRFSGEDSYVTDLNTNDAILSSQTTDLYVLKSDSKNLEYTFNFEDYEQLTFLFSTTEREITGTSKPITMKKIVK